MNKYVISFVLIIIIAIILFFLKDYYWLYLDNGGYPITSIKYFDYITSFFYTIGNGTFFAYDETVFQSSRFLGHILLGLSMFILFFIFFIFNFIFSYFLLNKFFSNKSSILGALIYTFNPISLCFLNLTGFMFAYTSLTIILLSIYYIIKQKRYIYILLLIIGLYFLINYTRILGIYLVFLLLIGLYFYKSIFNFLIKNKKYFIFLIILITSSIFPFIFSIIYPYIDGQKKYFSGLGNYAESSIGWGASLYNNILNTTFYEKLAIKEVTSNFAGYYQNKIIFILISYLFIFGLIIYSFFLKNKINKSFQIYLVGIFLFIIFILAGPYFLSREVFIIIAYKYFPFIANNTNWLYVILVPILVFLFVYSIEYTKNKNVKNIIIIFGFLYVLISIYPIFDYKNNDKLGIISLNNFPKPYIQTFHQDKISKKSALFLPGNNLYFDWSPYGLDITNNNSYLDLFSQNPRLVNGKQSNLYSKIYNLQDNNFVINNSIFNLKNIFVFKDIRNAEPGQFDFFPVKDYVGESKMYYDKFINDSNLYIKQDNENFAQFGLKDDDKYEYKIYSPASIIKKDIENFFDEEIDINSKPIIVDSKSFHKPEGIENFIIPKENQNVKIDIKESVLNPTKYYIKLSNLDTSKPFLLQMNQTFGMSWKIKLVDKNYFDEKPCIDEYKNFSITQNSVCNYDSKLLELEDIRLLNKPEVNNENHFEGNFVGNTWLIKPDDIPNEMKGKRELYAVIIYEKQIYYTWALIISGLTFLTLILLTIIQEIKLFLNRKKNSYENKLN